MTLYSGPTLSWARSLFYQVNPEYRPHSLYQKEPPFLLRGWVSDAAIVVIVSGVLTGTASLFPTPLGLTMFFFATTMIVAVCLGIGLYRAVDSSSVVLTQVGVFFWWLLVGAVLALVMWFFRGVFHGNAHDAYWGGYALALASYSLAFWV